MKNTATGRGLQGQGIPMRSVRAVAPLAASSPGVSMEASDEVIECFSSGRTGRARRTTAVEGARAPNKM